LRPVCDVTDFTSGDRRTSRRIDAASSADLFTEMPPGKFARIQSTPSSSCGRNSDPSVVPRRNAAATTAAAAASMRVGYLIAADNARW